MNRQGSKGSGFRVRGSEVQGSEVQGSEVQGSEVQGFRGSGVQGSEVWGFASGFDPTCRVLRRRAKKRPVKSKKKLPKLIVHY